MKDLVQRTADRAGRRRGTGDRALRRVAVRVEYDAEAHVTDLHRQRDAAVALEPPRIRSPRQDRAAGPRKHLQRPGCTTAVSIPSRLSITTDGTVRLDVIFEPDGK